MITSDDCLETAVSIGARLCRSAIWSEDLCTWVVDKPDVHSGTFRSERADAYLYQGASGVALFLVELAAHTSDQHVLRVAAGALRCALREVTTLGSRARIGFYSGIVGVAYALTRYDCVVGCPEFREAAGDLIGTITADTTPGASLDLIDGISGVIPALLHLGRVLDKPAVSDVAIGLGDRVIAAALHRPGAWSWQTGDPVAIDDQVGLAHGSTGVGYALLELARATGEARFLYGAEQAIAYDRWHFSSRENNWRDLRHIEVSEAVLRGQFAELTETFARTGRAPENVPRFSALWCYGAPGIGLARLRAYRILGEAELRHEVLAACAATKHAVQQSGGPFELCHGYAGNCELLVQAADALNVPHFRQVAEQLAAEARVAYELRGRPWPTASSSGRDPSLMLGEAGIGHFYLRLFTRETPAILLFEPNCEARPFTDFRGYETLRTQCLHEMFGNSLRELEAWQPNRPSLADEILRRGDRNVDPLEVIELVERRLDEEDNPEARNRVSEQLAVERAKVEILREPLRFSEQLVANVPNAAGPSIEWADVEFRIADGVRVVEGIEDADAELTPDPSGRRWYLVYLKERVVRTQTLQPFAALVMRSIVREATFDDIVSSVRAACDVGDATSLVEAIRQQLLAIHRAGLLRVLRTRQ